MSMSSSVYNEILGKKTIKIKNKLIKSYKWETASLNRHVKEESITALYMHARHELQADKRQHHNTDSTSLLLGPQWHRGSFPIYFRFQHFCCVNSPYRGPRQNMKNQFGHTILLMELVVDAVHERFGLVGFTRGGWQIFG